MSQIMSGRSIGNSALTQIANITQKEESDIAKKDEQESFFSPHIFNLRPVT